VGIFIERATKRERGGLTKPSFYGNMHGHTRRVFVVHFQKPVQQKRCFMDKSKNPIITIAFLERKGFVPTETQIPRTYNVLCVTKRNDGKGIQNFHIPITGTAIVRNTLCVRDDITVSHTTVEFNGKVYDLAYLRNGLSGSCLVISIRNEDQDPYDEWELYTDTPSANPDRPGEVVTPEELHRRAKEMIEWSARNA